MRTKIKYESPGVEVIEIRLEGLICLSKPRLEWILVPTYPEDEESY